MAARKKPTKTIRVARKSTDGRFTTMAYAERHRRTTEIETYRSTGRRKHS